MKDMWFTTFNFCRFLGERSLASRGRSDISRSMSRYQRACSDFQFVSLSHSTTQSLVHALIQPAKATAISCHHSLSLFEKVSEL
jgi:hypothetical protein